MSGSSDIVSHLNIRIETDEKKIHKFFSHKKSKKNEFLVKHGFLNSIFFSGYI